jgi:hypothetical protein
MLLMYFVSSWVVLELLMKRLQQPKAKEEAIALSVQQRVEVKGGGGTMMKKKSRKEEMTV